MHEVKRAHGDVPIS